MKRFETTVEIPITVFYECIKEDGDGWNSPKIPGHIEICGIGFKDEDSFEIVTMYEMKHYIMRKYPDMLLKEAQENEKG